MFNDYLTIDQASKEVGCTRRTLYRIIEKFAPGEVVTPAFGRQLIHISKLPSLREHYYPFGHDLGEGGRDAEEGQPESRSDVFAWHRRQSNRSPERPAAVAGSLSAFSSMWSIWASLGPLQMRPHSWHTPSSLAITASRSRCHAAVQ